MNCHVVTPGGMPRCAAFAITLALISFFSFFNAAPSHAAYFAATALGDYGNVAVMEVTGNLDAELADGTPNYPARQAIAKEFFRTHKDEYDFLVIFTNFDYGMPSDGEAIGFYSDVKNDVQGIGLEQFDNTAAFGSGGRLQGVIDMGNLARKVSDPLDPRFDETLGLLNHEMLHRWGAHLKFKDENGNVSTALLGRDGDHWSYLLDTQGSLHYGSRWRDNGDGTFTALEARTYFSPLDLYVMGMIGKDQVPPMLLIENPDIDPEHLPEVGATISGTARTVTIDDIIAVEGARIPAADQAQKQFKLGFIFATTPGTFTGRELVGIENIRNGFLTRYSILTDGQGLVQVAAAPKEELATNPGVESSSVTPRTLPFDLEEGVAWLKAEQQQDGSWTDVAHTRERDTAEAVATLKLFPEAQAERQSGLQWLLQKSSANTDFLARKLETLFAAGEEHAALVAELAGRQNPDGGWGVAKGFVSNPTDTALVLKVLGNVGYVDGQVTGAAIEYLAANQNTDGGWSGDGAVSLIQPTANALVAFNSYRDSRPLDSAIDAGAAWLLSKQNADGGFGNSPSTVYDSAAAVQALSAVGAAGSATGQGVSYLLAQQSADGSWYASPYQTAVAIQASWQATSAPDLAIASDDIRFIAETITTLPTNAVVEATVRNLGKADVAQATVALYAGGVADSNKLGEQTLAFSGKSETVVTFAVPVEQGAEQYFTVALDGANSIEESNEGNNVAAKALTPKPTYDFVITPADLALSAGTVDLFQKVTIAATVTNHGTVNAYDVPVRFYIDQAGTPFELGTLTVDIPAGGTVTQELTWKASLVGTDLPLMVQVDPFGAFAELDEENNGAAQALTVNFVNLPNISVSYQDMAVDPDPATQGGSVTFTTIVKNDSSAPAENVRVDFYHGVPENDGVLFATEVIPSLDAGQSVELTAIWSDIQEFGGKIAYVVVDPLNDIEEGAEDDNEAFATFEVLSLPDLALSADAVQVSPSAPKEGDPVEIEVTVQNLGSMPVSDVRVLLIEAGQIVGEESISFLDGNALTTVGFVYDSTGRSGAHEVRLEVDPLGEIEEQREDNNEVEKTFGVQNGDLWVSERYISPNGDGVQDSTLFFFRLEEPQKVSVVVYDEEGAPVRTFGGSELEGITAGNVVWDGLADKGTVVDDGKYRLRIVAQEGTLGELEVVVDNNRSFFSEAFGTRYLDQIPMPEDMYSVEFRGWHPQDGQYYLSGYLPTINDPYGVFRGGDGTLERITSSKWSDSYDNGVRFSPDGKTMALDIDSNLWILDGNENLSEGTKIASGAISPRWSPTGEWIAFHKWTGSYNYGLYIIRPDGTDLKRVDNDSHPVDWFDDWWDDGFITYRWSPDGTKIAYNHEQEAIWVYDLHSAKEVQVYGDHYNNFLQWNWIGDGRIAISGWRNNFLRIVDPYEQKEDVLVTEKSLIKFFVSPDFRYLVYNTRSGNDCLLTVYDTRRGDIVFSGKWSEGYWYYHFWDYDIKALWSPDMTKFYLYQRGFYQGTKQGFVVIDCNSGSSRFVALDNIDYNDIYFSNEEDAHAQWLDDNRSLLLAVRLPENSYYERTLVKVDTLSGEVTPTPLIVQSGYQEHGVSPLGQHLYYVNKYYHKREGKIAIFRSLLNLSADLRLLKKPSGILLNGSAMDRNFQAYQLEYAEINAPSDWSLIEPPSETEVLNDNFSFWVPPFEGTFNVRLTVWDKAGNQRQVVRRVSWGQHPPIANFYKSENIFSPNGDGTKDLMEFTYTVLEPVHLEFFVYDSSGQLVRRFTRNHGLTGEQSLFWDGTDGEGRVLRDGTYKVSVLDFEVMIEVDSTPPEMNLAVALVESPEGTISGLLEGHADDLNFLNWEIIYTTDNGMENWTPLIYGDEPVGAKGAESISKLLLENVVISRFSNESLTAQGGRVYRLIAEDKAGNRSSILSGPLEETVAIYAWDQEPLNSNVLPGAKTRAGSHQLTVFETVKADLEKVQLQYRVGVDWQIASASADVSDAGIQLTWNTATVLGLPNAIRVLLIDSNGQSHYSNTLTTENIFTIKANCNNPTTGTNYLFEELRQIIYRAQRPSDGAWVDYWVDDDSQLPIPTGSFIVPPPDDSLTGGNQVKIQAMGVTYGGREYSSNEILWPKGCGDVSVALRYEYPEAGCNQESGVVEVHALVKFPEYTLLTPKQLNLYRQTATGWELANSFGPVIQGMVSVETSAFPEGEQNYKATFGYLDGDSEWQEKSSQRTLTVDHTLPVAEITYPSNASQIFCPVKQNSAAGDWYGIPVEAVINDDRAVKKYKLFYGFGEDPASWFPAQTRIGDQQKELEGSGPLVGEIGFWDVSNLPSGTYSLKLMVDDGSGNGSCHTVSLNLRPPAQVAQLTLSEKLFSPNGDGEFDQIDIHYVTTDVATLAVEVYPLVTQADGSEVVAGTPVRTIATNLDHSGGAGVVQWDGMTDGGVSVGDGRYVVVVTATGICGTYSTRHAVVEVDNSPPLAVITAPMAGEPLGSILEVRGAAQDLHFSDYLLEVGQGSAPSEWIKVGFGSQPVEDGVFGVWSSFGLQGQWTLRLSASDGVGNTAVVSRVVDLGERVNILKDFYISPQIFSPNDDGKKDTAQITFELNASCQVTLEVLNEEGQVLATHLIEAPEAGLYSNSWDGRGTDGTVQVDGEYSVRISVSSAGSGDLQQQETLSVILDTTPPNIDIPDPADQSYLSDLSLALLGSIEDEHLVEYSVRYSGSEGEVVVDAGQQNRLNHSFGVLEELPEGSYVLNASALDAAENAAQVSRAFIIDRTPPALTFEAPENEAFLMGIEFPVEVSGLIEEAHLNQYSLTYGLGEAPLDWYPLASGGTLSGEGFSHVWDLSANQSMNDGLYSIKLHAVDKAGLEAEAVTSVSIDSQPPQVDVSAPLDGAYITGAFEIFGTASDANLTEYRLSMSEGGCETAAKWGLLHSGAESITNEALFSMPALPRDGQYCLALWARDRVAQEAEYRTEFIIDTRPPAVPVLTGEVERPNAVDLEWSSASEPDLAGFMLYRDGQPVVQELLAQPSFKDLAWSDGTYLYQVQAIDLAGNESALSEPISIEIDTTPPEVRLVSPILEGRVGGNVDVKGMAYSADDFREYRLYTSLAPTAGEWQLLRRSPVPVSNGLLAQWNTMELGGERYLLKLEAEDLSGNVAFDQVEVEVDNIPPNAPQLNDLTFNGSQVELSWQESPDEDLAGYLVFRNGQIANATTLVVKNVNAYLVAKTVFTDTGVPDGSHEYEIVAVDLAGNFSDPSNMKEVTIETRPPQVQIVAPLNNTEFEFKVPVKAESQDKDIASVLFQYKAAQDDTWLELTGGDFRDPTRTYLDPVELRLTYGGVQVRAIATDNSGNTGQYSPVVNLTYTDLTAPKIPEGLSTSTMGDQVTLQWESNAETDFAGFNIYRTSGGGLEKVNSSLVQFAQWLDSGLADNIYFFAVTAVDIYGNESEPSEVAAAKIYAPVLRNPKKEIQDEIVSVEGSGVHAGDQVEIFRETAQGTESIGVSFADAEGNFRFDNLQMTDGENLLTVVAVDNDGNISKASAPIDVAFTLPPQVPSGLSGSASGLSANLTWNPNPEPDVIGYLLYRDGNLLNGFKAVYGGLATASSTYSGWSSNLPEYAFDGETYPYWMSSRVPTGDEPEWIQADFQEEKLFSRIEIDWYASYAAGQHFEVQAWNGYEWQVLAEVLDNSDVKTSFEFDPAVRTDKVRIYIYSVMNGNTPRISEISLMERELILENAFSDTGLANKVYGYSLVAVDRFGLKSGLSEELPVVVGDIVPPLAPQGLVATGNGPSAVRLDWSQSSSEDADFAGYILYRRSEDGWDKINADPVTTTAFVDENLRNGLYAYRVTAVDQVGNESGPSPEAEIEVNVALPAVPTGLVVSALPEGESLRMNWKPGDGDVVGYVIYRATASGGPYIKVNSEPTVETSHVDRGVANGTVYYYVVTAADEIGNESVFSAEAFGTPYDEVAPPAPEFSTPVKGGGLLTTISNAIEITGKAEVGSMVELFRNGIYVDSTTASEEVILTESTPFKFDGEVGAVSPDGLHLAEGGSGQVCLTEIETRKSECYPFKGYLNSPKWSPDGKYVTFAYYDSDLRFSKLAVMNLTTRTIAPLTPDAAHESQPSWTRDGEVAFVSQQGNGSDLWLKGIASGEIKQLTNDMPGEDPIISPDGNKVVFINHTNRELIIMDAESGVFSSINCQISLYFSDLSWAGDSKKLSYVSAINGGQGTGTEGNQLFIVDTERLTVTPLASVLGYVSHQTWAPDNEGLVFYREFYDQTVGYWQAGIWITDLEGNETLVTSGGAYVRQLVWPDMGIIHVFDYFGHFKAFFGGYFKFDGIDLHVGSNVLYAVATDNAGNQSEPSAGITVLREATQLPDSSVAAMDIQIYPPYPRPGENVMVSATVHNSGDLMVTEAEVSISLRDSSGTIRQLQRTILPVLAPGGEAVISVATKASDQFGRNTVFVVIDPSEKIVEASEDNNYAEREFVITDKEEVTLSTRLLARQITSSQNLQLDITLDNSGQAQNVEIDARILDANGVEVAALGSTALELMFGSQTLTYLWNPGNTFSGEYRVHAVVRDRNEVVAENFQEFEILPDLLVQTMLQTDKAAYEPMEDVRVSATVVNGGVNTIIPELLTEIGILGPDQTELIREVKLIRNLIPGIKIDVPLAWNVALAAPGDYEVRLTATAGGQVVAVEKTGFKILPKPVVSGQIGVESNVVPIGQPISAGYSIANSGNTAASGLIRAAVIDVERGTPIAEQERAFTLPAGENSSGAFEFVGNQLELRSYRLRLQYLGQNEQKTIADALFTVIDRTPPEISVLEPRSEETYSGMVKIIATATDNASGVARVEYRIDEGGWLEMPFFDATTGRHWAQWEPSLEDNGGHVISCRVKDAAGNWSAPVSVSFEVQMDNVPPETEIEIGKPLHSATDWAYVAGGSLFTLSATDDYSGVASTEYRVDKGEWIAYSPFTLSGLPDGEHTIGYRSIDNANNVEVEKTLTFILDSSPPATRIHFSGQSFFNGETLLFSRETEVNLSAEDNLSGVAITQYRFDDLPTWSTCYGTIRLSDLGYGTHILRYSSIDNVGNGEEEKAVTLTLVGVEVETEVLNLPRVLVWTEDPATLAGKQRPAYTLEEVKDLVGEALGVPDIYATVTADRDEFRALLRSGIYNMAMILNQDVPFDTVFLREMREAVHRGTGLLVSSWGSSVPPLWQEVFGVDFKGSESMSEDERPLHLFDSPVGSEQSLTASGRVLRTDLDGGVLAGILPAESTCEGLRGLSLRYPLKMAVGDRVTVSLTVPQGKRQVVVDEEEMTVTAIPEAAINRFTGNPGGDLSIDGIAVDGITLTLAASYAYLEGSYTLSLTVEKADGTTVVTGAVEVTPVCAANLQAGMDLGPFQVIAVDEERVRNGDDLPAVVLGEYGEGRTAFLSYNLIESALNGRRSDHLGLLWKAATWLLPEKVQPVAGGVALVETRVKLLGTGLDLQTADTLGEGLTHLPLFDLTQSPLTYTFHLEDGEQADYRYFVRFADRQGDYAKSTAVLFGLEGGNVPFAEYPADFSVGDDSRTLLLQALAWVDGQLSAHPEAADALGAIRVELLRIDTLPRTTSAEAETIVHQTVQTLHQALQLGIHSGGLRILLDQYLRIIEGEAYFD